MGLGLGVRRGVLPDLWTRVRADLTGRGRGRARVGGPATGLPDHLGGRRGVTTIESLTGGHESGGDRVVLSEGGQRVAGFGHRRTVERVRAEQIEQEVGGGARVVGLAHLTVGGGVEHREGLELAP